MSHPVDIYLAWIADFIPGDWTASDIQQAHLDMRGPKPKLEVALRPRAEYVEISVVSDPCE